MQHVNPSRAAGQVKPVANHGDNKSLSKRYSSLSSACSFPKDSNSMLSMWSGGLPSKRALNSDVMQLSFIYRELTNESGCHTPTAGGRFGRDSLDKIYMVMDYRYRIVTMI